MFLPTHLYRCYSTSQLHASNSADGLETYSNHFNALAAAQAFKHHRTDLLEVTEKSLQVVSYLLSNDVIPEATKSRVLFSNLSAFEKSEALFDAIEARITVYPEIFHSVVNLLETESSLKMLAAKLRKAYSKSFNLVILYTHLLHISGYISYCTLVVF